ncbi:AAA family ATPase [Pirellula sp. SH-Sr6A]|uniref:SF1B family DNA helicase RecD2 n=1 Tax=Pirellula sp. SH-Sr6A TaxID=1632865 RepID=UPI00143AD294|nr:AAA family ATPase [Pirellula sp. SH-Sr6A]
MSNRISGTVDRVFFTSAKFSAGSLVRDDGERVRFRGPFCVSEGELITLTGQWKSDPKYGPQFDAKSVSYDLPETPEGLVQYLAKHPAFTGIGETTARKIVSYVASAEHLDRVIRHDVQELNRALRIPKRTLHSLREAWIANSAENEVRSYLAGFGLSHHQMETLLEEFGASVVGVLRANPYLIIRYIKGYGFKRVDKIARSMGVPKEHPGRIESALCYLVREEASDGHTWIAHDDLIRKAIDLLLLDSLDCRSIIEGALKRVVDQNQLIIDGDAVALTSYVEAERLIYECFELYGQDVDPIGIEPAHGAGLKRSQLAAYEAAMRHSIVVISGGAGTGKTHTLARLAKTFQDANLRIALCSPTGKAAKRIEESLRNQGLELDAKTIHRLLEYNGHEYQRKSLSPPDDDGSLDVSSSDGFDVIIIDEFSMVDVPLLAELLRRINLDRTRLILVGDHNQLPPVGPGNVIRDCIEHKLVPTFILDEVVRQAGVLKTNSMAILSQRVMPTVGSDPAWSVIDSLKEPMQIQVYLRDLVLNRIPGRLGLDPVNDVQIITPTHLGQLGTKAINQMMQYLLHGVVDRKFAVGDKVIQTSNDYGLGIMNGTIGIVSEIETADGTKYIVDFDGEGRRPIQDEQILNLQLAYAMTAHKAQGSEFPCVVVLCHKSHFFADRNWLYTAVTRASRYCIVVGDRWGLGNAVKKNSVSERRTFLDRWAKANLEYWEVLL